MLLTLTVVGYYVRESQLAQTNKIPERVLKFSSVNSVPGIIHPSLVLFNNLQLQEIKREIVRMISANKI